MDVTPSTPTKRSRSKSKAPAESASKPAAKPRKPRVRKAQSAISTPSPETVVATAPTPDELQGMIATAAYYLAEERNFSPGHELDDWLEAERRIQATACG